MTDRPTDLPAAIIAAAYRAILNRAPDPVGLAAREREFHDRELPDAIERMVKGLLNSAEFASKRGLSTDARTFIETSDIEVAMITHNEEEMLPLSLPALMDSFDRFLFLDMDSDDRTRSIIQDICGSAARIVPYSRQHLLTEGYGHARNFIACYASRPWLLAIDADEVIAAGVSDGKIAISVPASGTHAATVQRRNRRPNPEMWRPGRPIIPEQHNLKSQEEKRRIYRTGSGAHWEGYLHEELYASSGYIAKSNLVLEHYSLFRDNTRLLGKNYMYSWMLLQLHERNRPVTGVSSYWLNDYIPNNLERIRDEAALFTQGGSDRSR